MRDAAHLHRNERVHVCVCVLAVSPKGTATHSHPNGDLVDCQKALPPGSKHIAADDLTQLPRDVNRLGNNGPVTRPEVRCSPPEKGGLRSRHENSIVVQLL